MGWRLLQHERGGCREPRNDTLDIKEQHAQYERGWSSMSRLTSDVINERVNWAKDSPCRACNSIDGWEFEAGSYASELEHFEKALGGPLPYPRSELRLLLLFQDARKADKFVLASPFEPISSLGEDQHRYFCLTRTAWKDLRLDTITGSPTPRWPRDMDRRAFLERYLKRTKNSWSYAGFIAYLLHMFRPQDAYITNVAKCFADGRTEVYKNCAKLHLREEISMFNPTAIISFTGRAGSLNALEKLAHCNLSEVRCFMRPYHPAVWSSQRKALRLCQEISKNAASLQSMRCNPSAMLASIEEDVEALLG